uniref:Sodium/nucleoside cotransporter n=1 Tax=Petromyzon marinus TaxID=7757 RepID=A0AAJ7T1K2_PETMA|nr:solute carrier family 28 member 3 isoform X1 [Petromyzon marinus]
MEMTSDNANGEATSIGVDNEAYLPEYENVDRRRKPGEEEEEVADSKGHVSVHVKDTDEEEFVATAAWARKLDKSRNKIRKHFKKHENIYHWVGLGVLSAGLLALVIAACIINFNASLALLVLTCLGIFFIVWDTLMAKYEGKIAKALQPAIRYFNKHWNIIQWFVYAAVLIAIVLWLALDTAKQGLNQLIPFGGLIMLILIMFICSKHPTRVKWRPVIWGVGIQWVFGIIILRTEAGLDAFEWLGSQVQTFLDYADAGSKFVFGDLYTDHFFAFKVLPIVIFFSMIMSMLYYIGFMQWLILKVGWVMQITMGTSPTESLVAAGNIFVGQTESPLLIRPYLADLTLSEIHSVMTSGFATIAGSVLGAYISFGVPAAHLLTASVMSAPAALAISKVFWPETQKSKFKVKGSLKLEKGTESNLVEAASHGASASIPLVANIAANLIAFLALLAFINAILSWLGGMFNYPDLSFELICSYVFMPLAFMMGVDWADAFMVAELLGVKTFFNEFVAYERLSLLIKARTDGSPEYVDGVKQYMSVRSEAIATYALCGFANLGSIGIMIGGLSSMAPHRRSDIAKCAVRALISGTVACFMTACIAGILYTPQPTCLVILGDAFSGGEVPTNSSIIVTCCNDLFNRTEVTDPENIIIGGNYTREALDGCCNMMISPFFNCSWVV